MSPSSSAAEDINLSKTMRTVDLAPSSLVCTRNVCIEKVPNETWGFLVCWTLNQKNIQQQKHLEAFFSRLWQRNLCFSWCRCCSRMEPLLDRCNTSWTDFWDKHWRESDCMSWRIRAVLGEEQKSLQVSLVPVHKQRQLQFGKARDDSHGAEAVQVQSVFMFDHWPSGLEDSHACAYRGEAVPVPHLWSSLSQAART